MKEKRAVIRRKLIAVIILLAVWQLLSIWINKKLFLPSPMATVMALVELVQTGEFYLSVATSFLRILTGFVLAVFCGVLLAVAAGWNRQLEEILKLFMQMIKAIPVASFVILVLLWVKSSNLSVVISFLMVVPIIYANVRQGICAADEKLLEMAKVFRIGRYRKIRYIYLPALLPHFVGACSLGVGFCWKSGIAAEVIGLPNHSIGEQLYESKLYLMTPELFAWTIVIVLISVLFEKLVMKLIRGAASRI